MECNQLLLLLHLPLLQNLLLNLILIFNSSLSGVLTWVWHVCINFEIGIPTPPIIISTLPFNLILNIMFLSVSHLWELGVFGFEAVVGLEVEAVVPFLFQLSLSFDLIGPWTTRQLTIQLSLPSNKRSIRRVLLLRLIHLLHFFCIDYSCSHLDVQWLDITYHVMNASRHHHIRLGHPIHLKWHISEKWWHAHGHNWFLAWLDVPLLILFHILLHLFLFLRSQFSFFLLLHHKIPFWCLYVSFWFWIVFWE